MKYASLDYQKPGEYIIPEFNGGINLSCDSAALNDSMLADCKNMWYSSGRLRTRPGMNTDLKNKFEIDQHFIICKQKFTLTNTRFFTDNRSKKVGYIIGGDGFSYYKIWVYLADAAGEIETVGFINFSRVDATTFYVPEEVFFIAGEPFEGSGLYAFVTSYSFGKPLYQIFELSSDKSKWDMIDESGYYCPVIYMNGRGTRYEAAVAAGSAYEAPPEQPEQLNLLAGKFQAYFSSDGISPAFQLPISHLDDEIVICRVYRTPEIYTEWHIQPGENSAQEEFFTAQITVRCDRSRGLISFYSGAMEYPVPKMTLYGNNNIYIYASKTVPDGLARVISSKDSFVHNSRVYVFGNDIRKNEIYSARVSNPLYFPKNSKAMVGDGASPVTALAAQRSKLIAFKPDEIYKIDVAAGKDHLPEEVLAEKTGDMFGVDTLGAVLIYSGVGCNLPDTVVLCGNRLVWLGTDKRIYTLATTTYGNENNVYEISALIAPMLQKALNRNTKKVLAFKTDEYYMLIIGNSIFLMNYRIKGFGYTSSYSHRDSIADGVSWYYWELPEEAEILCGFEAGKDICAVCSGNFGMLNYLVKFDSDRDSYLIMSEEETEKISQDVYSFFTTREFDLKAPHKLKKLTQLDIELSGGKNIFFSFNGGKKRRFSAASKEEIKNLRVLPLIRNCERVNFTVSSSERFAVGAAAFRYENKVD